MAANLWNEIDGERWLDNPSLIVANPRRKKTMATRKRKTYRRRGRKAAPRRARRARRNYAASGLIANPRRRRSYRRGRKSSPRRVQRYRSNPAVLGMTLPPMDAILFTGAGMIAPPIVANLITPYLPEALRSSRLGYYTVKAASVLLPSMLVRNFVSRRAGNLMLLGGVASFVLDLVRETGLLPTATVGAQPFLGLYQKPHYQRNLGRYTGIPVQSRPVQRTPLLSLTPERLSPGARY